MYIAMWQLPLHCISLIQVRKSKVNVSMDKDTYSYVPLTRFIVYHFLYDGKKSKVNVSMVQDAKKMHIAT